MIDKDHFGWLKAGSTGASVKAETSVWRLLQQSRQAMMVAWTNMVAVRWAKKWLDLGHRENQEPIRC